MILPSQPATCNKGCVVSSVGPVPAGSKLLRCADRGSSGVLCVFGVYRSPLAFATLARELLHPYDTLIQLPDRLLKSLFKQLTLSPCELAKHRLDLLRKWRSWAAELAPARRSSGRLWMLMFRMFWGRSDCVFFGGRRPPYGRGPSSKRKAGLEKPSPLAKELHDVTSKEAHEKGWLKGKAFGNWLPVRRFPVEQKDKVRPIDDYKENGLNKAYIAVEKITLSGMDHMLWSLQTLLKFFTAKGDVALTLSTGEVLSGRVHPDWKLEKGSILVTAIDLRSAYKQLPLSPKDYDKTILVCKHPESGKVQCYSTLTLPFGACASVDCFLRISALLHAIGCELALLWTNYFDDFPLASHSLVSTSSLASC